MNNLHPANPRCRLRQTVVLAVLFGLLNAVVVARAAMPGPMPAPDTMEERAKPCVACHAAEGRQDKDAYYPRLAGKPAGYLFNQMRHFRDGARNHRAMSLLMENLTDDYLRALAGYFSALPVRYAPGERASAARVPPPALVIDGDRARRIPACASCHGSKLLGAAPVIPGLLGLPRDYISAQFGAWRVGTRHAAAPDCMGEIAKQLSPTEVTAIADWLASQDLPAGVHDGGSIDADIAGSCGSVRDATGPRSSVTPAAGKAGRP